MICISIIINKRQKSFAYCLKIIYIDGEIPKASNSIFGNCSGEGKNCPILLIHY